MVRWRLWLSVLAMMAGAAAAQPSDRIYDIPSMPLKNALAELARQADLSIAYNAAELDNYRSAYVFGATTSENALKAILSRSPYSFEFVGADTVRIVPRPKIHSISTEPALQAAPSRTDMILVTATKREAYAQNLPVGISAISGETLQQWGVRDFNTLAPKLAGVAYTNLGPSRNKIFLRGISDGSFADRTQSTVGVYLDETPIIFNDTNPDLRLIDMDRIEIIRGPQGTLYGAGSIGGVYRMITNKPDLADYYGRLRVSGSATQNGAGDGAIDGVMNLPVIQDRLGLRAAAYYEHASGYIDDLGLGIDDINISEIYGGRITARLNLLQGWTLDAAAIAQIVDLADTQYVFPDLGALQRRNARREPYRDEFKHFSLTLNGDVGGAKITSSSAFIHRDISSVFDATAALPSIIANPAAEGVYRSSDAIRTFNHESRIVSDNGDGFDWLLGGFYSHRTEDLDTRLIVDNITPNALPFFSDREDTIDERALFGEFSYEIYSKLRLIAGLRLSHTVFNVDVVSGGTANAGPGVLEEKRKHASVSLKVAFSYQHTDDLLIYVNMASGSRIGGFNVNTPLAAITDLGPEDSVTMFESDSLWNTEFGVKSSWLGGNLVVNASAFYVRWSEIQTDQILPNGFSFIANAGKARNYGFEAEITGRPAPNIEIAGAFFWNSPELTEANSFLGGEKGDALPNIAAVSASLGAKVEFPISDQWDGALFANYNYVGRSFLTFAEDTAPSMGDYHIGNIRLTAQNGQIRAGLYADNFFNERGNTFAFGNPFSLASQRQETPVRPRTIGAFVEVEF